MKETKNEEFGDGIVKYLYMIKNYMRGAALLCIYIA